ncbi:MAG: PilZ domain-containing protein [Alphaproteobacteria bacterium]|nr:PilZ domain-containing protein [Alphaproteobacteria bacterium]
MPVSTAKRDAEKDAIKLDNIRHALKCLRVNHRRTVVWPATLYVGEFEFRAMLYDISLGGVRLKLPLPLASGTEASVKIKNQVTLNSRVVWCAGEFIGLKFSDPIEVVRKSLGELSIGLK